MTMAVFKWRFNNRHSGLGNCDGGGLNGGLKISVILAEARI
jgi:hypothetical protein